MAQGRKTKAAQKAKANRDRAAARRQDKRDAAKRRTARRLMSSLAVRDEISGLYNDLEYIKAGKPYKGEKSDIADICAQIDALESRL
jgi:hypothetical protein